MFFNEAVNQGIATSHFIDQLRALLSQSFLDCWETGTLMEKFNAEIARQSKGYTNGPILNLL